MTAEYRVAKRPHGRVLVDYNQNRWGSTARLRLLAAAAARGHGLDAGHLEGDIDRGVAIEDFTIRNVPARVAKIATCGSRCSPRAAASTCRSSFRRWGST